VIAVLGVVELWPLSGLFDVFRENVLCGMVFCCNTVLLLKDGFSSLLGVWAQLIGQ